MTNKKPPPPVTLEKLKPNGQEPGSTITSEEPPPDKPDTEEPVKRRRRRKQPEPEPVQIEIRPELIARAVKVPFRIVGLRHGCPDVWNLSDAEATECAEALVPVLEMFAPTIGKYLPVVTCALVVGGITIEKMELESKTKADKITAPLKAVENTTL